MMNIFDRPCYHIKQVKKVRIPKGKRKKFNSKSMLCAWVTKLCPARCESCFFKSNMYHDGTPDEKYQFSEYGVDRLIQFINDSNNSYLMLSGGGEPMVRKDIVNRIVREVKSDRIVIVTSAIWAKTYESAKKRLTSCTKVGKAETMTWYLYSGSVLILSTTSLLASMSSTM